MQRAESVNNLLSKIIRDVISQYPDVRDKVQRDLADAFEILDKNIIDAEASSEFPLGNNVFDVPSPAEELSGNDSVQGEV